MPQITIPEYVTTYSKLHNWCITVPQITQPLPAASSDAAGICVISKSYITKHAPALARVSGEFLFFAECYRQTVVLFLAECQKQTGVLLLHIAIKQTVVVSCAQLPK